MPLLDSKRKSAIEQEIKKGASSAEIVHLHLRDKIKMMNDRYTSPDGENLIDVMDVANQLGCTQKQAEQWLSNYKIKAMRYTGRRGWYSRDEVSKQYCELYLRPTSESKQPPLFIEHVSTLPASDEKIEQMCQRVIDDPTPTNVWAMLRSLSRIARLKMAGKSRCDVQAGDIEHDVLIRLAQAYKRFEYRGKGNQAKVLCSYLFNIARSAIDHYLGEQCYRKNLERYSQMKKSNGHTAVVSGRE